MAPLSLEDEVSYLQMCDKDDLIISGLHFLKGFFAMPSFHQVLLEAELSIWKSDARCAGICQAFGRGTKPGSKARPSQLLFHDFATLSNYCTSLKRYKNPIMDALNIFDMLIK